LCSSSERSKGIKSFRTSSVPSPSSGVSSFEGVGRVVSAKNNFHAGRPAGNFGPPVSLFNRALGLFDYHLCHLDNESSTVHPLPALTELVHQFMVLAANSYPNESTRVTVIKDILSRIVAVPLDWEVPEARFGVRPDAINLDDTPFFVVEVKNEAGLEGDASLQAALSYAHIATSMDKVNSSVFFLFFIDMVCRIHRSFRTTPPFSRTAPLFFVVSWVTFLKSGSRRTQTGRTTIFCFLSGYAWASTLRKISSVSLELSPPLEMSSPSSGSSTLPPCQPPAASHTCSPRLYQSLPTPDLCQP